MQNKLGFKEMQPEDRHKVRINAKKLRYSMEFFYNLYPSKEIGEFIRKLAKLQDSLGLMNDISVTGVLLGSISKTNPSASLDDAVPILESWGSKKINEECPNVDAALKKLLKGKPFWIKIKK